MVFYPTTFLFAAISTLVIIQYRYRCTFPTHGRQWQNIKLYEIVNHVLASLNHALICSPFILEFYNKKTNIMLYSCFFDKKIGNLFVEFSIFQ